MLTFVVMPCLNEAALIAETSASLGFSAGGETPADTHLVIVDNGSTDGTLDILERIRRESRAPVHLVAETERGYVPARRRGVAAAEALARKERADPASVLILQADSDTTYKWGYVAAMRAAASAETGIMLEGATRRPPDFEEAHSAYIAAERLVDDEIELLDATDEDEVVVDDKVCGYRLSDYLVWGGLFDEVMPSGDYIYAETTRMFIRAKLRHGARKVRVNPAGAASSRRKVTENPGLHYATVGFPREATWVRGFCRAKSGERRVIDVDAFARRVLQGREPEVEYLRRAHQLALFRYAPALVASVAVGSTTNELPEDVAAVLAVLPRRSCEELARGPGAALVDVLGLIDTHTTLFGGRPARPSF
ncbi:glycosyltransferase family 2 protein [Sphingopyxis chilensis]